MGGFQCLQKTCIQIICIKVPGGKNESDEKDSKADTLKLLSRSFGMCGNIVLHHFSFLIIQADLSGWNNRYLVETKYFANLAYTLRTLTPLFNQNR